MNDRRKYLIPGALVIGCLPWFILGLILLIAVASSLSRGPYVGLIRVSGVITAGRSGGGMLSGDSAGSETIVRQLEEARRDKSIKAVVIRINSPGGSPAGSEEVYNEIMRVRKAGKKVYVSMGDVAASGGYYIASAADRIYADASTVTGSIGVIYEGPEMTELLKKVGVSLNVVKTGKFKDVGNPARPMTPEERALIKGVIMNTYGQFVEAVSRGRKIPVAKVRSLADGRVFTGEQAKSLRLIDDIGGMRETVLAAGKAAGIKGEPKIKEFKNEGLADIIFGTDEGESSAGFRGAIRSRLFRLLFGSEQSYSHLR